MIIRTIKKNGRVCAVVEDTEKVILDAQTALDVLMSAKYNALTKNIVIDKTPYY